MTVDVPDCPPKIWWGVGILFLWLQCCFIFNLISTTGNSLHCTVSRNCRTTPLWFRQITKSTRADDVSEVQNTSWTFSQSHQYLITKYTLSAQSEQFQLHQLITLNEQEINSKVDYGTWRPLRLLVATFVEVNPEIQPETRMYTKNKTLKGSFDCFILNTQELNKWKLGRNLLQWQVTE